MTAYQEDQPTSALGTSPQQVDTRLCARHHLVIGWWSLLLFLTLGVVLEGMHGFKIGWYLSEETRRLMWRLAHAHGTLLAVVHIAFGATVAIVPEWQSASRTLASRSLLGAGILIPGGFFLGGFFFFEGDPGLGILLLPAGALLLFLAVLFTARAMSKLRFEGAEMERDQ